MGLDTGSMLALVQGTAAAGGAASAYNETGAIRAQGRYESKALETNARLDELRAQDATRRGKKASDLRLKDTRQLIGAQRARLAAQGIDVNSETALQLQQDAASAGAVDALQERENAWLEAWGYRVQAQDARGRARFTRLAARNQARSTIATGGVRFANDLLTGAYYANRYGSSVQTPADPGPLSLSPNPNYPRPFFG